VFALVVCWTSYAVRACWERRCPSVSRTAYISPGIFHYYPEKVVHSLISTSCIMLPVSCKFFSNCEIQAYISVADQEGDLVNLIGSPLHWFPISCYCASSSLAILLVVVIDLKDFCFADFWRSVCLLVRHTRMQKI
jgi:hypothetical protein